MTDSVYIYFDNSYYLDFYGEYYDEKYIRFIFRNNNKKWHIYLKIKNKNKISENF